MSDDAWRPHTRRDDEDDFGPAAVRRRGRRASFGPKRGRPRRLGAAGRSGRPNNGSAAAPGATRPPVSCPTSSPPVSGPGPRCRPDRRSRRVDRVSRDQKPGCGAGDRPPSAASGGEAALRRQRTIRTLAEAVLPGRRGGRVDESAPVSPRSPGPHHDRPPIPPATAPGRPRWPRGAQPQRWPRRLHPPPRPSSRPPVGPAPHPARAAWPGRGHAHGDRCRVC